MQRLLLALALAAPASFAATPEAIPELRGKWRYARVGGFEILSDCSDSKTRSYVCCVLRAVPLMALPKAFQPGPRLPQTLILTERLLDAELAPPGCPPELAALRADSNGAYAVSHDSDAVVVRVGLTGWQPMSITRELSTLPLRLVPVLLRGRTPRLPAWADAGLTAVYRQEDSISATERRMLGLGAGHYLLLSIRDAADHPDRLMPLAEVLAEAPPPADAHQRARWRAHAALFARWGVLRLGGRPEKFWEFCDCAASEPVTEALFLRCFGIGYAAAQRELAAFLGKALANPVTMVAPADPVFPGISLRDATRAEICRIEGEWQRLTAGALRESHPALADIYLARARRILEHAHAAGEREPQLLAALGLCRLEAGATAEARRALEEAHAAKAARPQAQRALAGLRIAEAGQFPAGAGGRHSPAQTLAVLRPLYVARAQPPSDADTYRLMAEAWLASEVAPAAPQLADLLEAGKQFPRESELLLAIAQVARKAGAVDEARKLADNALRFVASGAIRSDLERVRDSARP